MSNKKIPHRLYLTEDQMPRQWYNLRADMPEQPDPLLNPGTLRPLAVDCHGDRGGRPGPGGL